MEAGITPWGNYLQQRRYSQDTPSFCLPAGHGRTERNHHAQTFLKRKQLGIKTNGTSFWENINAYSSIIKMSNYIYIKIRTLTFTY